MRWSGLSSAPCGSRGGDGGGGGGADEDEDEDERKVLGEVAIVCGI